MKILGREPAADIVQPVFKIQRAVDVYKRQPLYNTIFLPLTLAVMASRICDAENKGNTYKLLL